MYSPGLPQGSHTPASVVTLKAGASAAMASATPTSAGSAASTGALTATDLRWTAFILVPRLEPRVASRQLAPRRGRRRTAFVAMPLAPLFVPRLPPSCAPGPEAGAAAGHGKRPKFAAEGTQVRAPCVAIGMGTGLDPRDDRKRQLKAS